MSNLPSPILGNDFGGFINKFRNAAFDIAKRGASGSVSSAATAYTLDGWQVAPTGAAAAWSQQYQNEFNGNALQVNCATGMTALTVQQRIESYEAAKLLGAASGARPVTVQFLIYNNTGAALTVQIAADYANAQDNFSAVTSDLAATNLQTIANGNAGTVAYTYTPSANINKGLQIRLLFGGALNASSGQIAIAAADIRATPGQPTGLNASPPPPELRSISAESALCQRYFRSTYASAAPGTSAAAGYLALANVGASIANNSFYASERFPVTMRVAPTVTIYSYNGTSGEISNASNTDLGTNSATAGTVSVNGFSIENTNGSSVSTSNNVAYCQYTASAEL